MGIEQILTLLVFLFPLAYSPGPGNMFFAANGARFGFQATLGATAGYHIATFVLTVPIGLGFAVVFSELPELFLVLKVLGALYVLSLAWKLFRAGEANGEHQAVPANFIDGAALLVLNPKAYIIIMLMFSQFLEETSTFGAVVVITVVFTLNNLVAFTLWTLIGDRLARLFRTKEKARYLNTLFGGLLGIVGLWMLFSQLGF